MSVSNVVLVTIDSLRYDRALQSDRAVTPAPTLSRLAKDGFCFNRAFANGPNTPSSFPTLLTGTYPAMYGGYRYLDERRPFLSATLQDAGMRTVGYHSNPHLGPEKNYNHGFDTFNDGAEDDDDARTIKNFVDEQVPSDSRLYTVLRRIWHYVTMKTETSAYAPATEITDRAIDWLESDWDGHSPYFMWLHYMDVHYPFTPPDRFLEDIDVDPLSTRRTADLNGRMQEDPDSLTAEDQSDLLDLYDGEIRYMDHNLNRLLEKLEAQDAREDTTVVVTADHGEAFGEHDRYGHHPYNYDELLHVPLVFDVPGRDGRQIDQQVSLIDVPPTLYDLLGVETPEAVQGRSLEPLMAGEEREEQVVVCTASGGGMLATRTPEWKLLWDREADTVELYHLTEDPGEEHDVSAESPEIVEQFRALLEDHAAEARATDTDLPEVEESDEVKQRLEDLGYVE
ncbi:sulfatase [Halorientalis regularis]|uniref:Arylsulfatase A n=1 Tax=Halorientalis regularis TaxID=660518 RepID=A0A1G7FYR2_9EURY|nr:sulfatase [Halorientalis regularis]SDE80932.1 Arylsulfatase A [Halorientalis regularis]